jgi:hypothetical protein
MREGILTALNDEEVDGGEAETKRSASSRTRKREE